MTDVEYDRYALRSFELRSKRCMWPDATGAIVANVSHSEAAIVDRLGVWSDRTYKIWAPISGNGREVDWLTGTCVAVCRRGKGHQVPAGNCKCGIYGSLSYADLIAQFRCETRRMIAVIAAEGQTIFGARGLRTAIAKVVAYWTDLEPVRLDVASRQFPDATLFHDPLEMMTAHRIALLPPPLKGTICTGPEWWTSPRSSDEIL